MRNNLVESAGDFERVLINKMNQALEEKKKQVLFGKDEEDKDLDSVDKSELKGKHTDRDDKDIDNDGDVDSSDKFLHKKRKAITKAMKKESTGCAPCEAAKKRREMMGAGLTENPTDNYSPNRKSRRSFKSNKQSNKQGISLPTRMPWQ